MSDTLSQIQRRRDALAARADLQRTILAIRTQPLLNAMARADRLLGKLSVVRRHPAISLAIAAGLLLIARRRLLRVARWGWSVWQVYRMMMRPRVR